MGSFSIYYAGRGSRCHQFQTLIPYTSFVHVFSLSFRCLAVPAVPARAREEAVMSGRLESPPRERDFLSQFGGREESTRCWIRRHSPPSLPLSLRLGLRSREEEEQQNRQATSIRGHHAPQQPHQAPASTVPPFPPLPPLPAPRQASLVANLGPGRYSIPHPRLRRRATSCAAPQQWPVQTLSPPPSSPADFVDAISELRAQLAQPDS